MRAGASSLSDLPLRASLEPNYHQNISKMIPKSIQNQSKINYISIIHACLCLTSLFNELLITFWSTRPMLRSIKTIEKLFFFQCFCTFDIFLQLIVWSSKLVWTNHHFGIQTHQKSNFKRVKFINSLMILSFHNFYWLWEAFGTALGSFQ